MGLISLQSGHNIFIYLTSHHFMIVLIIVCDCGLEITSETVLSSLCVSLTPPSSDTELLSSEEESTIKIIQ